MALKMERASVAAKGRQIESETPIRYVVEFVGANTDSERALRRARCGFVSVKSLISPLPLKRQFSHLVVSLSCSALST
jgi:hypothetical protein